MFSHVFIGISDFDRALEFYRVLMEWLGLEERFCEYGRPWAGWHSPGSTRPLLIIGTSQNQQPHSAGNGQMAAFNAADRKTVDLAQKLALAKGGMSEGSPGLRPEYHDNYYGAYFLDPDRNKFCVVCHVPEN